MERKTKKIAQKLIEKQDKEFQSLLEESMSNLRKNDVPPCLAIVSVLDVGFSALFATTESSEEAYGLIKQMLTKCEKRYVKIQNQIRELNPELSDNTKPERRSDQPMEWN